MDIKLEREIKKAVEEKTVVLGANSTIKGLAKKQIKTVIVADTCPESIKEKINKSVGDKGTEIKPSNASAKDLGEHLRKPFSVSVMGIKKSK